MRKLEFFSLETDGLQTGPSLRRRLQLGR